MSSPLKTVWQQGRIYGIGNILNRFAGLLLIPILLHTMSTEAWGAYALIVVIGQVLLTAPVAFVASMVRLYFETGEKGGDKVVSTTLAIYLVIAVLIALVAYPLAQAIGWAIFGHQDYFEALLIANVALIFEILFDIEMGYYRLRKAANLYVGATLARSLMQFGLCILFAIGLEMGVTGLMLGHLLSVAVLAVPIGIWMVTQTGWTVSRPVMRELLHFGLPLLPSNLAKTLLDLVGRAALNILASTSAVGIFSLAAKLAEQIHLVLGGPFENIWTVQLAEVASQQERAREVNRVLVYLMLLVMVAVLALALYAPEVVMLLSAAEFWGAIALLPLLAFGYVARIFYVHFETCVIQSKRTAVLPLINWVSVGVAVGACILLIPPFGLMGAAAADVLARAFRVGVTAWAAVRLSEYGRRFPWGPVSALVLSALATYMVADALIGREVTVLAFLLKGGVVALYAGLAYLSPILSGDERQRLARSVMNWLAQARGRPGGRRVS